MRYVVLLSVLLLAVPMHVQGAEQAGEKTLICAVTGVQECLTGEGCKGMEPEQLNLPRFVVVDTAGKTLSSPQEGRVSAIRSVDRLSGMIVLQGAEETNERRGAFGWSMSIDEETGDLVFAASGQRQSVVVFGSCMEK